MRRTDAAHALARAVGCLVVLGLGAIAGCSREEPKVTLTVGAVTLRLTPPRGWDHVDNGGRHDFRRGDEHMLLADVGIALPETLAAVILAARDGLERESAHMELTRLGWRDDPVLRARSDDERAGFWRYWNDVIYDPTRRASPEIRSAVDTLVARSRALAAIEPQAYVRWLTAQRRDTLAYQIHDVAEAATGGGPWWVARTWTRTAHQYEQRYACGIVAGRLIVLESGPMLAPDAGSTFERVLASVTPAGNAAR